MCTSVTIGDQDYETVGELQAVLGSLVPHISDLARQGRSR